MKRIFILLNILLAQFLSAQVTDNFTDGDFTASPVWSGDAAEFAVNGTQQLQLNASVAGASYLSTPNVMANLDNKEWRCFVKQTFAGSSSNYGRVYLVSDQANLEGSLNGYYLQFGEALSNDAIELFEQTGLTSTSVCRGTNAQIAASFTVGVQVKRDAAGLWTLSVDAAGGTNYVQEATGTNIAHTTSSFMGVADVYTVGNITKFFYDDFYAGALITDTNPPTIVSATPLSTTTLDVLFNEDLDPITSQVAANYSVNNSIGNPSSAVLDGSNAKLVHLTFATAFTNGLQNTITINAVQDLAANPISGGTANFTYLVFSTPTFKDVIINEIMVDVNPVPVGVPAKQYLELYNRSANYFNLNGWQFSDAVSTATVTANYTFAPNTYVIIAKSTDTALFVGVTNKIGTSTFPTYNTTGDPVFLRDNASTMIDSIRYTTAWYNDASKSNGGWSLELINPSMNINCVAQSNWTAANGPNGGTPGVQNSVYNTSPDITAPQFSSVTVIDSVTIQLCFNEAISSSLINVASNYSVNGGIGNASVALANGTLTCVTLSFATPFTSSTSYTVSFAALTDCSGNAVSPSTGNFTYIQLSTPSFNDVIINEILVDVNPVPIGVPAKQYLELYNKSVKYFNLNGWTFADAVSTSTVTTNYTLAPGAYVVIAKSTDTSLFVGINNKIGTSSFPTYNTTGDPVYLKDNNGNAVDSIRYTTAWYNDATKSSGGWSLELINPTSNASCADQSNWTAASGPNGGTPGVQNSVYNTSPDVTAPQFSSVTVIDSVTLQLCFNEAISSSLMNVVSNYSVNGGIGNPTSASANSTFTCVTLGFATPFTSTTSYTVSFASLADCSGNVVSPTSGVFTYFQIQSPSYNDVILTEIMVDINPVPAGVPAKQYLELYNKSNKYFNLTGWQFADAASTSTITSNYVFAPNSYVVIAKATDTALFTGVTNKIGTSTFPSYNVGGDPVYLYDNAGNALDSISYTTAWYNDVTKSGGGWSLELINPTVNGNCYAQNNWAASVNSNGGTPGAQNSVYSTIPDLTAPQFASVTVLDSVTIQLCFNEAISASLMNATSNYSVNGGIGAPTSAFANGTYTCVTLGFATPFTSSTSYTVSFASLADCSGNIVTPTSAGFTYFLLQNPAYNDVVINEIMVDVNPIPVGVPAKQYLELYNKSNKYFNLNGWQFADAASTSTITSNYVFAPNTYVVIAKTADTALFTGITNKIGTSTFPSYNIGGDPVYLYDNAANALDSISYNTAWYNDATKSGGGWSLELINPTVNGNCYAQNNWAASTNSNGGTPGVQNSVYNTSPDVTAPQFSSVVVIDSVTVEVCFNEAISTSLLTNASNYSVNSGIGSPSAVAVNSTYKCATLSFVSPFTDQTTYVLSFASLADCNGNIVTPSSTPFTYVKTQNPSFNDVIVTEILVDINPVPVGVPAKQYLELYNKSTKYFNINGWQFSDRAQSGTGVVNTNYVLAPNTYVVITKLADTSLFVGIANKVGTSSFPAYNTTGDGVYVQDGLGNYVDSLNYDDTWYRNSVKKNGGWSLELINPTLNANCEASANWTASNDANGGTPGAQNSVYSIAPDVTAPHATLVSVSDSLHITVCFNEGISSNLIGTVTNYSISNGIGTPVSAVVSGTSSKCVDLVLANPLQNQTNYVLTMSNLSDCSGNVVSPNTINFSHYIAKPYDVVINELFADPDPQIALPSGEYIELYNRTNYAISLKDWKITVGNNDIMIPDAVIQPDSFIVLIDDAALNSFINEGYGAIAMVVIPAFASNELNATGEEVVLHDKFNNLISYVNYSDSWYQDATKKAGGWSLEQIDPLNPCSGSSNWRASVNPAGGTPGSINSINASNPDNTAPQLVRVNVISADTIVAVFSESMQFSALSNVSAYSISNGIGTPVTITPKAQEYTQCVIKLPTVLQPNTIYTLTVTSTLYDCAGNAVTTENTARFGLPQDPVAGDVVINELLFDPKTDGVDYVELYNNSAKIIDLYDVYIGQGSATSTLITGSIQVTPDGYQLFPGEYVVLSKSGDVVKSQYKTENPKWFLDCNIPAMNTTDDVVVIADVNGVEIDKVVYSDKMHFALLNITKGVSLERIDFNRPSSDKTNWNSASANVGFGTPAYRNSQYMQTQSTGTFSVEPEIFSPDNDGYQDVVTINYTVDSPGLAGNVTIYDSKGVLIRRLVKNENLATSGSYSWNGITEQSEKAPMGIYVVYFETFSTTGKIEKHKLTCVLAGKL